jgi:phage terminase large subunit
MNAVEPVTIDLSEKYDPRRNKKQMLFHAAPETYKLYGGAMGGGKTAALVNEGIQLNLEYPGNLGLLIRKTFPSFKDTVFPQLEYFLDSRLVRKWNRTEKLIEFINRSRIRYGGLGDDPDDWKNWMSGEYGWIAMEQAEDFSEQEFKMLATRLRLRLPGIRYFFLLSCNPSVGWLKTRFVMQRNPDHIFIPSSPYDNIANLPQGYIEKMEQILDENQRKALLHGDWEAVGEADNVYSYHEVEAARTRRVPAGLPVEIGVDVARFGDDETTIFLREGLRLEMYAAYRGHDLMQTCGKIWRCIEDRVFPVWRSDAYLKRVEKGEAEELKEIMIKVDADGMGAGVVDRLRELAPEKEEELKIEVSIREIHGAAMPRDKKKFKNRKAEIHFGLREMLDRIEIPKDDELFSQLMAIKYKNNSAGLIIIMDKEELKEKLGRSPDRAEGLIYALADMASDFGFATG